MFFQLISFGDFPNSLTALVLKNIQEYIPEFEVEILTYQDSLKDLKEKFSKYDFSKVKINYEIIPEKVLDYNADKLQYTKPKSQNAFIYRIKRLYELKKTHKFITILDNDIFIKRSFLNYFNEFVESGKTVGASTEFFSDKESVLANKLENDNFKPEYCYFMNFGFAFFNLQKLPSSFEQFKKEFLEDVRRFTVYDQSWFSKVIPDSDKLILPNLQLVPWALNWFEKEIDRPDFIMHARVNQIDLNKTSVIHFTPLPVIDNVAEMLNIKDKSTKNHFNKYLIIIKYYPEFYEFAKKYKTELGSAFSKIENVAITLKQFYNKNKFIIENDFYSLLKNSDYYKKYKTRIISKLLTGYEYDIR